MSNPFAAPGKANLEVSSIVSDFGSFTLPSSAWKTVDPSSWPRTFNSPPGSFSNSTSSPGWIPRCRSKSRFRVTCLLP